MIEDVQRSKFLLVNGIFGGDSVGTYSAPPGTLSIVMLRHRLLSAVDSDAEAAKLSLYGTYDAGRTQCGHFINAGVAGA